MKREIMDIFDFDFEKILNLIRSGRDCFLLTQDYAPTYISYEKLSIIYREIVDRYDSGRIIIKPHPGDTMDYHKLFPDCYILEGSFPFELCSLVGLPIAKVISINSTALYGLFSSEQVESYEEYFEIILREAEKRRGK